MLRACRYYGHTREYWWSTLTWSLYAEMARQLAEEPPVDQFIALYFASQKWWSPPGDPSRAGDGAEPEMWSSPLPDFTE